MKREFFIVRPEWGVRVGGGSRLLVFAYVATMCENTGECKSTIATIARATFLKERSAMIHLQELVDGGFLMREQRAGKSTIYKVVTPAEKCTPANICTPAEKCTGGVQKNALTPAEKCTPQVIINNNSINQNKTIRKQTRAYAQVIENQNLNSRGETPREEWLRLKAQTEREQAQRDAQEVSAQDREQVILMQKEWRQKHKLTN